MQLGSIKKIWIAENFDTIEMEQLYKNFDDIRTLIQILSAIFEIDNKGQ